MSRDHSLLSLHMTHTRKVPVYTRRIRECQRGGQRAAHNSTETGSALRVPNLTSRKTVSNSKALLNKSHLPSGSRKLIYILNVLPSVAIQIEGSGRPLAIN